VSVPVFVLLVNGRDDAVPVSHPRAGVRRVGHPDKELVELAEATTNRR